MPRPTGREPNRTSGARGTTLWQMALGPDAARLFGAVATPMSPARQLAWVPPGCGSGQQSHPNRPRHSNAALESHMSSQSFTDLGVSKAVSAALAKRGFTEPFAIQNLIIGDILAGRDVLAKSPTGSGKT